MGKLPLRATTLLLGVAACASAADPRAPAATRLALADPTYRWAEARVLESLPPRLVVELRGDMPTPGWTVVVDSVEVDREAARIVLRITETPPSGIVSQVITPARVQADLGPVPVGRYCLEVWTRRGTAEAHSIGQSFVVTASDGAPPPGREP